MLTLGILYVTIILLLLSFPHFIKYDDYKNILTPIVSIIIFIEHIAYRLKSKKAIILYNNKYCL